MPKLNDIVSGLEKQTSRISAELTMEMEELDSLRPSWQRFNELNQQIESNKRRVGIGVGVLRRTARKASVPKLPAGVKSDLREHYVWRIIREILRQVEEMQICELHGHLTCFGLKVTRQAVESAITIHKCEFRVRNHGRDAYVALK